MVDVWLRTVAQFSDDLQIKAQQNNQIKSNPNTLVEELNFFKRLYSNTIIYHIVDDSMDPQYQMGEYVIGLRINLEKESQVAIYKYYLVQLDSGLLFFRRLQAIDKNAIATLHCLNLDTHADNVWMQNVAVKLLAPIIWHRKMI